MSKTLLILKPDAVERRLVGRILGKVEETGFALRRMELVRLSAERARRFYAVHEGKPFLDDLVRYMTSGPCIAAVLELDEAVPRLRQLMGATDPGKAAPGTLRADFGVDIQMNSVHGSDSTENARKEIAFFFPDEDA